MKKGFYARIALAGIMKNRRLYIPYILSGAGLAAMSYILIFLSSWDMLRHMKGGGVLEMILPIGVAVVCLFSLIFMFYSNSFLIRRRYREFGLYNVLGMDKRNLGLVMLWENLIVFIVSVFSGLVIGIALSKLAELAMVNLVQEEVSYTLRVDLNSALYTALMFAFIFFLLLLNSLVKVRRSSALELMKSSAVGEKAPKANWLLAVAGALILGIAYYIALSIEKPLSAILWFMLAVVLVIIATYLLFVSGSVAFCRALQKNKSYYYKPGHFVSVSSMVYRMKRNGAGLASICILITMVLVMLTSTISLYAGEEDTLETNYPSEISLTAFIPSMDEFNEENFDKMREAINARIEEPKNVSEGAMVEIAGMILDDSFTVDQSIYESLGETSMYAYEHLGYLNVITLDHYNKTMGTNETLSDDECLLSSYRTDYEEDSISLESCGTLKVKAQFEWATIPQYLSRQPVPVITIVINDIHGFLEPLADMKNQYDMAILEPCWNYAFDVGGDSEAQIAAFEKINKDMEDIIIRDEDGSYSYSFECRENARNSFYSLYGALFFLGILLSIIFVFAAVLIIYYKQVSEGYEDQKRFEVMRKVGMTSAEIRKSVNSQVLTVFFAPLALAGVHLAVAFPIIWKMLQMFMFSNMTIMLVVNIVCFAVLALIYALVYKLTSNAYFSIVSGNKA